MYGHNYNNNYVPVHYIYYYTSGYNNYHGSYYGNGGNYADDYSWDYGSGGGGSESQNSNYDDHIDDSKLTGKEKCLNKLLTEGGTNFVKDLLKNFEGKSEFDIKIQSKDKVISKGREVNGTTSPPINNVITINISTSNTKQNPALEVAKTILHEYIHADIYRKLNTKYSGTADLDFKKTYEAYEDQHEAMGALYVNSIIPRQIWTSV